MQNLLSTWPPSEAFYIQSMLFNSHSAKDSILKLEAVFEKLPPQFTDEDLKKLPTKQILNELHNMVLQAGALARYFWPVRKEHKQRGELLCKYFDMSEESPLFSRVLRNATEHFDERLDKYFEQENIVGYFFPEYVGEKPSNMEVPTHFFRAYFVDTGEFQLLDNSFYIQPVADELQFIQRHLEHMDTNGGRFRVVVRDV